MRKQCPKSHPRFSPVESWSSEWNNLSVGIPKHNVKVNNQLIACHVYKSIDTDREAGGS